jgi:hypothetical protein
MRDDELGVFEIDETGTTLTELAADVTGIGVSFFTEIVGAGPIKNCDILGLGVFDSCEIRVHPTGSAIARRGTKKPRWGDRGFARTRRSGSGKSVGRNDRPSQQTPRVWL